MFTTVAIIIPIRPIKRNDPSLARDFFVTYPYRLAPKNAEEETKKEPVTVPEDATEEDPFATMGNTEDF